MQLPEHFLAQGHALYNETTNDENRAIRDPIITSFGLSMKLAGYKADINHAGCRFLRECPHCPVGRSKHSARYSKDGETVWGCPTCKQVTA